MTPHEVFLEARRRGLRLEPRGDKLAVMPKGACPPDFADVLRENRDALLAWLRGGADYWRERPKPDLALPEEFFRTYPTGRPAVDITADLKGYRPGGSVTAWLYVARQILAGEFQGADASTCESLW